MPRPRSSRHINYSPLVTYFKPQGVPLRFLEVVELSLEEIEAIRLKNLGGFDQEKAAIQMKTSQSTFQRIITSANSKVADALINGKAIAISTGVENTKQS